MLKHALILFTTLLAGCVSTENIETSMGKMYNVSSSGSSQFDDIKYIRLANIVCADIVMFELYQDTPKAKKGYVLLNAGTKSIDNIGNGKSLHLKINDKRYSFKSNDVVTDHETIPVGYGVNMHFSHKSYLIPEPIIRDAAVSDIFVAKVNLLNKTNIEGKCSSVSLQEATENSARLDLDITQENVDSSNKFNATAGFQQFVEMMDATKW